MSDHFDALAKLPWIARLPSSGKVALPVTGEGRYDVIVRECQGLKARHLPNYVGLSTQREVRIANRLDKGEDIDDADRTYLTRLNGRRAAARERARCGNNAQWVYVGIRGNTSFLCGHHFSVALNEADEYDRLAKALKLEKYAEELR